MYCAYVMGVNIIIWGSLDSLHADLYRIDKEVIADLPTLRGSFSVDAFPCNVLTFFSFLIDAAFG